MSSSVPARETRGHAEGAGRKGPEGVLVLASNPALKINPPAIDILVTKSQALEGNGDLRLPAGLGNPGLDMPDGVPLAIENAAVASYLTVELGPLGIGIEEKTVTVVIEGIEYKAKGVGVELKEIPVDIIDDQRLLPSGIKTIHPQVKVGVIVEDPDLRSLGAGLTVSGFELEKIAGGRSQRPLGFIQLTVDLNRGFDFNGRDPPVLGSALGQRGRLRQTCQPRQEDSEKHHQRSRAGPVDDLHSPDRDCDVLFLVKLDGPLILRYQGGSFES